MDRAFYNRADEIRRLVRFLADASGGLVVLYGRRRCGKSTLLQRVLAAEHVYLQADQRETPLQLESLATVLSRRLPDFDKVRYRTWDELLASLYARVDRLHSRLPGRIPVSGTSRSGTAQHTAALHRSSG